MSKSRGTQRERAVKDWLCKRDWIVFKTGGSFGPADLAAMKAGERNMVIQVKSDKAGPFAHFGPTERRALIGLAEMAGAEPWLVWWPPYSKPIWIAPAQWPKERTA